MRDERSCPGGSTTLNFAISGSESLVGLAAVTGTFTRGTFLETHQIAAGLFSRDVQHRTNQRYRYAAVRLSYPGRRGCSSGTIRDDVCFVECFGAVGPSPQGFWRGTK